MDCVGGQATDNHYEEVQVEFLLHNTTSVIHPMDERLIRAFKTIQNAVKVIKKQTPTSSWKKSWPNKVTHDYEGFIPDEVHHSAVDRAVRLARLVATEGFSDMIKKEVNTLIDCHSNPRTDEDLER